MQRTGVITIKGIKYKEQTQRSSGKSLIKPIKAMNAEKESNNAKTLCFLSNEILHPFLAQEPNIDPKKNIGILEYVKTANPPILLLSKKTIQTKAYKNIKIKPPPIKYKGTFIPYLLNKEK